MCYSELLDILGQENEAIMQIKRGIEIDPFVGIFHAASGIFLYNTGKFKESLEEDIKTIELNPDYFQWTSKWIILTYIKLDEGFKAAETLEKLIPEDTGYIKEAFKKEGTNGILKCWIKLELKKSVRSSFRIAELYATLKVKEEALVWLEKSFEEHLEITELPRINTNPNFDNLHSEPRFTALIEKMGLSKYHKKE